MNALAYEVKSKRANSFVCVGGHVYSSEPIEVAIGSRSLTLLRVKDLERLVDREALLRDDTEEPPYWAHLWTGALTLARYIDSFIDVREPDRARPRLWAWVDWYRSCTKRGAGHLCR